MALAGVLAMRPEVLLLDEPSMYLDPRGRREPIELLNGLGGTKVIASHDLELVLRTCGRAVVLDGGRVAADGPVELTVETATVAYGRDGSPGQAPRNRHNSPLSCAACNEPRPARILSAKRLARVEIFGQRSRVAGSQSAVIGRLTRSAGACVILYPSRIASRWKSGASVLRESVLLHRN